MKLTPEMQKQHDLWLEEKEDLKLMMQYHKELEEKAKSAGLKLYTVVYEGPSEILTDFYTSQENYHNGEDAIASVANLEILTEVYEEALNGKDITMF